MVVRINFVTYNISKILASILAPIVGNTPHHIPNSQNLAKRFGISNINQNRPWFPAIFLSFPSSHASLPPKIHKRLLLDNYLPIRTALLSTHICTMLDLCWNTTYFKYGEGFYRQKHGCAIGSPVSLIVANLYMDPNPYPKPNTALLSLSGIVLSHWFRYVDDTWIKIKTRELEALLCSQNWRRHKSQHCGLQETSTPISTSVLTHTTHWNTSWGLSKHCKVGPKKYPPQPRGQRKNRNTLKPHWEHVATQTEPSSNPPENETPRKKKIEINVSALLSCICLEFWKNSGKSSKNMTSQCSSNSPTPSDRDWFTPRTKY